MNEKIPRIIHYCWFGGNKMPDKIMEYVKSWGKILPNYEFIEWNENNFDHTIYEYANTAYAKGKFAFVSDVARIYALKNYGGIYLDTDVEVFKSFDEILDKDCVFGFEEKEYIATSFMACIKEHPILNEFLEHYKKEKFINEDGSLNLTTNVERVTKLLLAKGLERNGDFQILQDNILVYPQEYFSPYDYINCVDKSTENTICRHNFNVTWGSPMTKFKKIIKKTIVKLFGGNVLKKIRRSISKNED